MLELLLHFVKENGTEVIQCKPKYAYFALFTPINYELNE